VEIVSFERIHAVSRLFVKALLARPRDPSCVRFGIIGADPVGAHRIQRAHGAAKKNSRLALLNATASGRRCRRSKMSNVASI
jgi:hypothetical protein